MKRQLKILALLAFASAVSQAQPVDVRALAETLKQGGYVIVFRHGATHRDQADTDPLNHDNVAKQRLLSDGGKDVARQVGLVATPIENDRRAEALRKMAATPPEAGKNTLLVTHKPNIIDAFGKDWFEVKEGEASVFRPDGNGKAAPVARIQAAEWIKAAN